MNTLNVILKWVKELDKKHCFALIGFLVISAGLLVCISQATAGVNGKEPAQFNGVFRFAYPPVKSPGPAALRQSFMADKALENVTAGLNSLIAVPADITIAFTECGVINAFYEPSARRVNMCYELIEHFAQLFLPYAKSEEALGKAVEDALNFVFFHELGHALSNVLDLPITGKEEDAVDQLSTFLLAEGDDDNEASALNGAYWFLLEAQQRGPIVKRLFADEHSLDQQRYFNVICWLYGQNQQGYQFVVNSGMLPADRAERCPNEYAKIAKSWRALLGPYIKNSLGRK